MFIGIAYRYLSKLFHKHGIKVSRHTSWYIVVPIFMTLLSATGFQKFSLDLSDDSIIPSGGIIDKHKSRLIQLFPIDLKSNFDPERLLHVIHYGTVIVEATDGGSILREFVFREIVTLDREIQNFFVEEDDGWNYKDICAKNNGKCYENKIIRIDNKLKALQNGTFRLKYPIGDTSRNYDVLTLGGVELNEEGCLISAKAVKLFYFLDDSNKWAEERAASWENRFVDILNRLNFSYIKTSKDVFLSRDESKAQVFLATLKYIPSSVFLMVMFTVVSCLWPDFLRSKPWTGIMSSMATGMSVISGYGVLLYVGHRISPVTYMIPFLILENKNFFQRIFCFVRSEDPTKKKQNETLGFTKRSKNFNQLMRSKISAIIILFAYFTYLGISIWGLGKFTYGQELEENLIRGTYRYNYYKTNEKYYNRYKYRLQLFITQELDYSNRTIQQNIENMLQTLESDPLIAGSLTESWLRSYLKFFDDNRTNSFLTGYNIRNSEDFLFVLHKLFFRIPEAKRFRQDIVVDSSSTRIISTRFFLQTNVTSNGSYFYNQFKHFQEKLNSFPFTTVVYHPLFYYFDAIDAIPTTTIQTLGIVSFTVSIISAMLLPNVICIVCVLFSIISVGAGVMGFMFLFNLALNLMSLSVLVIVIGYSVDYAAHVSCAYISAKESSPDKRLENAISLTAIPIIQGSVTTILAIVTVLNVSEKETLLAIKVIILACVIAGIHGLTFVPIIISMIDRIFQKCVYFKSKCKSSNSFSPNR